LNPRSSTTSTGPQVLQELLSNHHILRVTGGDFKCLHCPDEPSPLIEGTLEGYEIECSCHGSKFDVRTGEVTSSPATEPESAYEVEVGNNNDILIRRRSKG
jgi:nitrite reductase/ring-hydroxylating ferredoxin subunit